MRPRLSVIICIHDMIREAPRTIMSAAVPYQVDVSPDSYEVIVVDNGSQRPLPATVTERLPQNVVIVDIPKPRPSPVFVLNWAVRELARGEILLLAIDGARIFSERLYVDTLAAHALLGDSFVYTLSWHLGPKNQSQSIREGYSREVEDRLLRESGWPGRPSALYEISVLAGASRAGFFGCISESNAWSAPRGLFEEVGGYDERFTSPGGGFANAELFARYVSRSDARNVCLLSAGTFHQVHGGVATSLQVDFESFRVEYRRIFGRDYVRPSYRKMYFGKIPPEARRFGRWPRFTLPRPGASGILPRR